MSYDFHIGPDPIEFSDTHPGIADANTGGATVMVTEQGYSRCGNYTSNVSFMWTRCLTAVLVKHPDAERWCGDDARLWNALHPDLSTPAEVRTDHLCLRDLEGKAGAELAPVLASAVEWGIEHLAALHERDPENGWGDADGAVTYLWDIQRACEANPRDRLEISS